MAFVCNALAYWAIPPLKCEHRVYSEVWQILKDLMSGIGIVIVSDASMVSSEHMMAAAQVFTHDRMKNSLSRSGIAHVPH